MCVNILAVGDVVGASGLAFLRRRLRSLIRLKKIAFTVVNGENAALRGLTPVDADEIFMAGADVITLGNHTFGKSAICNYLDDCPRILRPANLAPQNPGRGWGDFETAFGPVRVVNLVGRCGMDFHPNNPFLEMDRILKNDPPALVLVDLHAEATSEKLAMGYDLDGRVSAVWGTHTHVQTSDAHLLPKGTGYITDLGMTGPAASVLGIAPEQSIAVFRGGPPRHYTAASGPCKMECAIFEVDVASGRCQSVEALRITE